MKTASDIRNQQYLAKNAKFIQHNIEEFADVIVGTIAAFTEENIFSSKCALEFHYDDSRYQKYYLNDFDLAVSLLCEELRARGFKYKTQCDCGVRVVEVRW